jgi:predicted short-subunit dehydrogenase-like oxidoreductase (DUF2520 family)
MDVLRQNMPYFEVTRVYFMKFNLIGGGRLGKNVALATQSFASLQAVCNRDVQSANQCCLELSAGEAVAQIQDLHEVDLTWITCNDDSIEAVAHDLAQSSFLKPRSLVIHCSGVLSSVVLEPLKDRGCFIASVHPLKSFKKGYLDAQAFYGVNCVLEGDEQACHWLTTTFTSLGAHLIPIKSECKPLYHAAASMASNYLVTLAAKSEALLVKAGIPEEDASNMVYQLMQGTLNNVQETRPMIEALTGPLKRGDYKTLAMHLKAIEDPVLKDFYKIAGLATLSLIQLPEDLKQRIEGLCSLT